MKMNRINIVCLGVRDMERSVKFYRDGLGFQTKEMGDNPGTIFFNTYGTKFSLYPLNLLTEGLSDTNPPQHVEQGVFNGTTLAFCVKSVEEVHDIIELARKAGATITKEPKSVTWKTTDGGDYTATGAYFTDPDGYYWEVSHLPGDEFDENDMFIEIGTY